MVTSARWNGANVRPSIFFKVWPSTSGHELLLHLLEALVQSLRRLCNLLQFSWWQCCYSRLHLLKSLHEPCNALDRILQRSCGCPWRRRTTSTCSREGKLSRRQDYQQRQHQKPAPRLRHGAPNRPRAYGRTLNGLLRLNMLVNHGSCKSYCRCQYSKGRTRHLCVVVLSLKLAAPCLACHVILHIIQ